MIVVAKVGSTSITSDSGEIDEAAIGKFCADVVRLRLAGHRVVMVTSGAIAAGLPAMGMSAVRTRDAVTPSLTTGDVLLSLTVYVLVYAVLAGFGTFYIYKLLHQGPAGAAEEIPNATASRPLAFADTAATATGSQTAARRDP